MTTHPDIAATASAPAKDDPFLALLERLLSVPSPSGHEGRIAELIREEIRDIGFEPTTDPAGNVYVHLDGATKASRMIMAAHMDEVGATVEAIDPDGRLRINRSGRTAAKKFGEGPVQVLGDFETVDGILGFGTGHAASPLETGQPDQDDGGFHSTRVITGLTPAALDKAGVRPGSPLVPPAWRRGPVVFGPADDPMVGAWTFDDRAGVVMLLRLLRKLTEQGEKPARPTTIAFTMHEEGRCHGAKYLSKELNPEIFFAVDGTPILTGTPISIEKGPCIWTRDQIAYSDTRLIHALRQAALRAEQPLQFAYLESPFSDASIVHDAGFAPRIVTFGHVRENSHGFEVTRRRSFTQAEAVLWEFVRAKIDD